LGGSRRNTSLRETQRDWKCAAFGAFGKLAMTIINPDADDFSIGYPGKNNVEIFVIVQIDRRH
jgi:hypothetical protein